MPIETAEIPPLARDKFKNKQSHPFSDTTPGDEVPDSTFICFDWLRTHEACNLQSPTVAPTTQPADPTGCCGIFHPV